MRLGRLLLGILVAFSALPSDACCVNAEERDSVSKNIQSAEAQSIAEMEEEKRILEEKILKAKEKIKAKQDSVSKSQLICSDLEGLGSIVYDRCFIFPLEVRCNRKLITQSLDLFNKIQPINEKIFERYDKYCSLMEKYENCCTEIISYLESGENISSQFYETTSTGKCASQIPHLKKNIDLYISGKLDKQTLISLITPK